MTQSSWRSFIFVENLIEVTCCMCYIDYCIQNTIIIYLTEYFIEINAWIINRIGIRNAMPIQAQLKISIFQNDFLRHLLVAISSLMDVNVSEGGYGCSCSKLKIWFTSDALPRCLFHGHGFFLQDNRSIRRSWGPTSVVFKFQEWSGISD